MNIRFLTIPLMALCLVACSSSGQDDPSIPAPPTPNPDLKSIGFGGNSGAWQDAPTSRATDSKGLETLFKSFRVWGYKSTNNAPQIVMDGYKVEYKENTEGNASNTSTWEYVGIINTQLSTTQTIKYWDYSASDYRFFAYASADSNNKVVASTTSSDSETSSVETSSTFSIPYTYSDKATTTTTPYFSDLWYSDDTSTTDKFGNTVKLTFAPVIAKVRFKFSYPDNIKKITIKDIQFRDSRLVDAPATKIFPIKGTISASYPQSGTPQANEITHSYPPTLAWTTSSDADANGCLILDTPYEEENDKIHILNDKEKYNKWYYLPPLGLSTVDDDKPSTYTIGATINGKHSSATVPADYTQWKAGYQYTYIFKITEAGDDITFDDLEVEIWKPGKDIDNNGSGTIGW